MRRLQSNPRWKLDCEPFDSEDCQPFNSKFAKDPSPVAKYRKYEETSRMSGVISISAGSFSLPHPYIGLGEFKLNALLEA